MESFRESLVDCVNIFKVFAIISPSLQNLLGNCLVDVCERGPVSRKSRKLFGRISGDIILFVSSKRGRLETRNFAVIFIFIPFTTYEKISFTE